MICRERTRSIRIRKRRIAGTVRSGRRIRRRMEMLLLLLLLSLLIMMRVAATAVPATRRRRSIIFHVMFFFLNGRNALPDSRTQRLAIILLLLSLLSPLRTCRWRSRLKRWMFLWVIRCRRRNHHPVELALLKMSKKIVTLVSLCRQTGSAIAPVP